jgi:hypothetical protein
MKPFLIILLGQPQIRLKQIEFFGSWLRNQTTYSVKAVS